MAQWQKRGYNERLFLGSLAAGGTLGILIPPSMNMIVFGSLTNTSVPQLFIAGVIPGILLTGLYMVAILAACLYRRDWGGRPEPTSWAQLLGTLPDLIPPLALFIVVMGSIYGGWATPTEAAALGTVGAFVIAAMNRRLSWRMLAQVLEGTVRTSATVMLFIIIAFFLNFAVASVGLVKQVNDFILGLGWTPLATMVFIMGIYIIMGMFMDALAMVVLTVPIITPIVVSLGYDPVWFGVMIVILCETAMLTPPVGMACFVIQSVRGTGHLSDIFIGITPFLACLAILFGLMLVFPQIALFLPSLMFR
jgi:tripartite ATP-independent transporter DctM subunit